LRGAQEGLLGARALEKKRIKEHCYAILITQEFKIRIVVSLRFARLSGVSGWAGNNEAVYAAWPKQRQ
jgi:hypothetical protein